MAGKTANIKEVSARVERLAEDFNAGLNSLKDEFMAFRNNRANARLDDSGEENVSFLQKLEEFQGKINSSLVSLRSDVSIIKKSVTVLQQQTQKLELQNNSHFLIINGIKEENNQDLYDILTQLFKNKLSLDINKSNLSYLYRMGKKIDSTRKANGAARPIAVKFCQKWARDLVFNKKRLLKGSGIVIVEMLTSENISLFKKVRAMMGKSAWTFNGVVYVESASGKKQIKNESEIGEIVIPVD